MRLEEIKLMQNPVSRFDQENPVSLDALHGARYNCAFLKLWLKTGK